jgi:hypothetical protein
MTSSTPGVGGFSLPHVLACMDPTSTRTPDLPNIDLGRAGNVIPLWAELYVGMCNEPQSMILCGLPNEALVLDWVL